MWINKEKLRKKIITNYEVARAYKIKCKRTHSWLGFQKKEKGYQDFFYTKISK
jgi:hypothetical protein